MPASFALQEADLAAAAWEASPPAAPPAAALPAQPEALPQAPTILKRVDDVKGYLGAFTCAAIVEAPAEEVLRFLSTPSDFPKVYSAIQSVEEVGAAAPGGPITFVSHSVAHVLGLKVPAAIKMRLARSGELVRFATLEPSGMISAMDGVNAVVALPPGSSSADLEVEVDKFLGSLGVAGAGGAADGGTPAAALARQQVAEPRPPFASVALGLPAKFGVGPGATPATKAAPVPQPERCLVVMHQRLKVKLCPPGMGKLLRSHLMGMHSSNLQDLLAWLGGRGRQ
ncbi:hypothetical protein C2E21_1542 [Chlorella sorokiniana]|uniref:Uncharacterized protein n=1 Tax=Chlorella sorokiniana TaxID=3076 RepID=A0A2P6U028_CHLSO|nr:hypothetical protein C2E21_1542 [Chlorella sorokiniana]|eukprot:PRW59674.1 hypothetical protein C2E21_1542 [Chlorella sorokiniana]